MKFNLSTEQIFAITRIFVYLTILGSFIFFFQSDFVGWLEIIPESAWTPVGVTEWLYPLFKLLKNSNTAWLGHIIVVAMALSAVSCVFEWKWRVTSVLTFVLSVIVFGLKNSFGHAFRSESILIIVQVIFIFRAYSLIDHLWALRCLRFLWISIFFLSALNKLRFSGLDWISDNYVLDYIRANQITRAGVLVERPFSGATEYFTENILLTKAMGIFTLLFELCYPLILFKRMRKAMLISTALFQSAIFVLLGVNFFFYLPLIPIWYSKNDEFYFADN